MNIRIWPAMAVALVLSACTGGGGGGPRDNPVSNVFDICRMYAENPHWAEAATEAERRWGVPQEVKMAIIWRESAFRAEARPPYRKVLGVPTGERLSSAYGFPQAIDGTWAWYLSDANADEAARNRFEDAIDFVGWYVNKTIDLNGIAPTDAYNQYLAYHEGHAGYRSGRWRSKAWLRKAARDVALQAERYRAQLGRCDGRRA